MSNPASRISNNADLDTIGGQAFGSPLGPMVSLGALINATTTAAAFPARPVAGGPQPVPSPPNPQRFKQLVAPAAGPAAISVNLPVTGNSAALGANLYVPGDVIVFQRTDTALAAAVNIIDGGAGTPNISAIAAPVNRAYSAVQLNDAGTHWEWVDSGSM